MGLSRDKRGFAPIGILIAVLVVGILAGGGFYAAKKQSSPAGENEQKTEIAGSSPTSSPDAEWKTYRNEQYGFEIKHPDSYSFNNLPVSAVMDPISGLVRFFSLDSDDGPPGKFFIEIYDNPKSLSVTEWFDEVLRSTRFNASDIVKTQEALGSMLAHKFASKLERVSGLFIAKDGKVYGIQWLGLDDETFREIASSFRFLNDPGISTWKTYRNEKYGFEVKYPDNWTLRNQTDEEAALNSPEREKLLKTEGADTPNELYIYIHKNSLSENLEDFVKQHSQGWYSNYKHILAPTIGAKQARRFSDIGSNAPHAPFEAVFVGSGSFVIEFSLAGYETKASSSQIQILDAVLSTLKFIESKSSIDTSSWKTYRSEKYAFELKYPEGYVASGSSQFISFYHYLNPDKAIGVGAFINGNQNGLSLWDWAEKQIWPMPGKVRNNFEEIKLDDGSTALKVKDENAVYIVKGQNYYIIDDCHNLDCTSLERDLFLSILNTFKFIELNIFSWKTYYNEQYGFEFKYPSDWEREPVRLKNTSDITYLESIYRPGTDSTAADASLDIYIRHNPNRQLLDELFQVDYQKCMKSEVAQELGCPSPDKIANWRQYYLEGYEVFESGFKAAPEGPPANKIYVKNLDRFLVLEGRQFSSVYNLEKVFSQILSTLKFF